MTLPSDFVDQDNPSHICKLRKAIYDLNQAPRAWYHELYYFLINFGFKNSYIDTSLFVLDVDDHIIYLLVYIDDFILIGDNLEIVDYFVQTLAHWLSIKDLGFLGLKIIRTQYEILLFSKMIYYGHSSSYSYNKYEATFHSYELVEILLILSLLLF